MSGDIYMTQEGYEKLVNELEHLKTVKRRALARKSSAERETINNLFISVNFNY
jgi:transcription elongation GreA/GreB family factor